MKPNYIHIIMGIGLSTMLIIGCIEQPLKADLSNTEFSTDTLHIYNIEGTTYQIPPSIGSKRKLTLGTSDDFNYNVVLIKTAYSSSQSSVWTLSSFTDTTIRIDSAFLRIMVDKDSLESPNLYSLYYFPNSTDSIFSESESNYLNFTENEISGGMFVTTVTEEEYEIDSSNTGNRLSFPVLNILDSTFFDTSGNYTFMFKEENPSDEQYSFFSREFDLTGSLSPKLEIYFRQFTYPDSSDTSDLVKIDTLFRSFLSTKDLSILIPPDVSEMDTTYISIGRGMGLRSLISLPTLDSLVLPNQTTFAKAELTLHIVPDSNISSFSIWAIPLEDTAEFSGFKIMNKDDISVNNSMFSSGTISDNMIRLNIKDFIQNHTFSNVENLGIKLFANINNNLYTTIHIYSAADDSLYPKLLLHYVAP